MECSSILKNDKDSIKYRRNLNTLVVLGTGVIIFGFWGIIKIIAQSFLGLQIIDPADLEELGPVGVVITMILTAAILSLDVILRLYVGLRARREAGGKKYGVGHLIVCGWLIIGSVLSIVAVFWAMTEAIGDFFDNLTAIFLELSSLVTTVEVFAATISVRRYRRKYGMEVG
jgi:hypothetical protein